jgi:SpoVK/Ycf46/Vps4 family AAA+-type ATPase
MQQEKVSSIEEKSVKITANDTIVAIMSSVYKNKLDEVYNTVELYAKSLGSANPHKSRLLSFVRYKPVQFKSLKELDNSTKLLIIESEENSFVEDDLYVPDYLNSFLQELILEWDNKSLFEQHKLPVRTKILFHGITGNGKTTMAKYIAKKIKLPFIEVNASEMVKTKIGESSAAIHKLFNSITEPCVLFWDEIDSICSKRTNPDQSADTENNRMVNTFLVNLPKLNPNVIFICATNKVDSLDSAVLRRFDDIVEILPPDEVQKKQFVQKMLGYYKISENAIDDKIYEEVSYSKIKDKMFSAARKYVLSKIKK